MDRPALRPPVDSLGVGPVWHWVRYPELSVPPLRLPDVERSIVTENRTSASDAC